MQLHPERVPVAGGLERLVPPAGAVEQGGPNRLRHAPIEVVDDRRHRIAQGRARITLGEPMAGDEALLDRLVDRRGVVVVGDRIEARARVEPLGAGSPGSGSATNDWCSWTVTASGVGVTSRTHAAGRIAGEGEDRLDLGIPGKAPGPVQEDGAPRAVEPEGALPAPSEPADHVVRVAEREVGGVHQDGAVTLRLHLEPPEHRLRERLLDRATLGRIVGRRPEPIIGLHHQHPGPDPVEPDDPLAADLASVEPDVVGPDPVREGHDVEDLLAQPVDLEPELAAGLVPIEGQQAVDLLATPASCRRWWDGASGQWPAEQTGLPWQPMRELLKLGGDSPMPPWKITGTTHHEDSKNTKVASTARMVVRAKRFPSCSS